MGLEPTKATTMRRCIEHQRHAFTAMHWAFHYRGAASEHRPGIFRDRLIERCIKEQREAAYHAAQAIARLFNLIGAPVSRSHDTHSTALIRAVDTLRAEGVTARREAQKLGENHV